jgi:hypothetical protein
MTRGLTIRELGSDPADHDTSGGFGFRSGSAVAANRVRMQAIRSRAKRPVPAAEADALHEGIESLLSRADRAARGVDPGHIPFISWWRGNCVEAAFHNLH